ncbi:MAG: hypothetical protein CYPHOPRED_004678 [Cyphobasidiales sp. Tagirdzhanova-0007]|nr:MAG: hypothetical protein CYPHOPRED_004678 [Cyphobasidiales sp. Tagirdzhanova-0007]
MARPTQGVKGKPAGRNKKQILEKEREEERREEEEEWGEKGEDGEEDDDEEEHQDEEYSDDEDSQNIDIRARKGGGKGKANGSQETHSSRSGGTATSNGHGNGSGPMQPLLPLHQPQQPAGQPATHRSPVRTVSLNESRRRLSGKGLGSRVSSIMGAASDLRRQSLPSSLRKSSAPAFANDHIDPDASFTSSNGHGAASPARTAPSTKQANAMFRRTSNGYALSGGGIGALNAANALRRNASGNSTHNTLGDASLPMPALSIEVMNTNYEEWMKMATDNAS